MHGWPKPPVVLVAALVASPALAQECSVFPQGAISGHACANREAVQERKDREARATEAKQRQLIEVVPTNLDALLCSGAQGRRGTEAVVGGSNRLPAIFANGSNITASGVQVHFEFFDKAGVFMFVERETADVSPSSLSPGASGRFQGSLDIGRRWGCFRSFVTRIRE